MPEIEVSGDQLDYLDGLREDLEDRFVDGYGHVRRRDALQFLIDRYEADGAEEAGGGRAAEGTDGEGVGAETDDEGAGTDGEGGDGDDSDRLRAMMNLLDRHDDAWEEADGEEGKYLVTLPGGETEHARTKDDVRALLFQHYR